MNRHLSISGGQYIEEITMEQLLKNTSTQTESQKSAKKELASDKMVNLSLLEIYKAAPPPLVFCDLT
jgi:hypothetical protein